MKFKIVYVKTIPEGYIGMNYWAAKELKIPFPNKKYLIWIKKGMSRSMAETTIQHEKIEAVLMKKGMKYHKAHILSNAMEEF
jgi:hypothetical protein